jgi:hypothetical protein
VVVPVSVIVPMPVSGLVQCLVACDRCAHGLEELKGKEGVDKFPCVLRLIRAHSLVREVSDGKSYFRSFVG